ncbi:hotdog fold thioesterase [Rhodococcus fascians]|nr:hotdog fold thioesterase [Rhodococcus fascians]MBY4237887.1 hotdog fold thioesterase [Rhodococcus fascians]MBY4253362.1 hotdog fold thioesterase [Rhodococcus fascians]MBY4268999.1 hotdog fold thioesterase [Rhodococcus fascians]MBY4275052.1 hotdog fold thioesterase [Rhodococcus fascians]
MNDERGTATMQQAIDPRDACALAHGIEAVQIGEGYAKLTMVVRADMLNPHGICHGGITFLLADTAVAYASGFGVVTTTASVVYPKAAAVADLLTAECHVVHQAKKAGIYDVMISDSTGTPVCLVRGQTLRIGSGAVEAA